MKPSQIKKHLRTCIYASLPSFIHGAPGVGKSQVVKSICKELGIGLIDIRLSLLDSVDLRGLPYEDKGITKWAIPEFLPVEERDGKKGVIFFDELNTADKTVQAASYQLILDRKLGEYTLPPGWVPMAAGNRAGDRAIVNKLSTALANRFIHLDFEPDTNDWVDWAFDAGMPDFLVAFIRHREELLHNFDPKSDEHAFASPRTWEFVGRMMLGGADPKSDLPLFAGTIGEGPAQELAGYWDYFQNLPDPLDILMNPDTAIVPEEPSLLYAVATAIPGVVTPDRMDNCCAYLDRLEPEFQVLSMRDIMRRNSDCTKTKAFVQWSRKHRDVLC